MNPSDHAASADSSLRESCRTFSTGYLPVSCWRQITQALLRSSSKKVKASRDAFNRKWRMQMGDHADAYRNHVDVTVLDRPSGTSALLSWKDPTSCNYGYQLWRRSVAKRDGFCAMSGHRIQSGDSVYRPRVSPRPANATAMILASLIESVLRESDEEEPDSR